MQQSGLRKGSERGGGGKQSKIIRKRETEVLSPHLHNPHVGTTARTISFSFKTLDSNDLCRLFSVIVIIFTILIIISTNPPRSSVSKLFLKNSLFAQHIRRWHWCGTAATATAVCNRLFTFCDYKLSRTLLVFSNQLCGWCRLSD